MTKDLRDLYITFPPPSSPNGSNYISNKYELLTAGTTDFFIILTTNVWLK